MGWKINQAWILESWSSHGVPGEIRRHTFIVDAVNIALWLGSVQRSVSGRAIQHLEITRSDVGRAKEGRILMYQRTQSADSHGVQTLSRRARETTLLLMCYGKRMGLRGWESLWWKRLMLKVGGNGTKTVSMLSVHVPYGWLHIPFAVCFPLSQDKKYRIVWCLRFTSKSEPDSHLAFCSSELE